MKFVTMAFAAIPLALAFATSSPAVAYENCAVNSYQHCMACGAKYGHVGTVQTNFCARKGFPPPGRKSRG